jgi:2-haloacid dehalogenase
MPRPTTPKAVLFDLLTALMDSWFLWDSIAGNVEDGRRRRAEYLQIAYTEGRCRAYQILVREAALAVGLSADLGDRLVDR